MAIKLPRGIKAMQLCDFWVAGYWDKDTYDVECFILLTKKKVKDSDPPPPPIRWATESEVLAQLGR